MQWLQNHELLNSQENLKALQKALTLETDVHPFSVTRKGKQLTVVFHLRHKPALLLCTEDEKQVTLLLLQHWFSRSKPTQAAGISSL